MATPKWLSVLKEGMEKLDDRQRKMLLVAGGAVVAAGVLGYCLYGSDGDKSSSNGLGKASPATHYFKVHGGKGIGIRFEADIDATRTGRIIENGESFGVCEIREGSGKQRYLRLADGRGWVFTHGPVGQEIAAETSWEQAIGDLDKTIAGTPATEKQLLSVPSAPFARQASH